MGRSVAAPMIHQAKAKLGWLAVIAGALATVPAAPAQAHLGPAPNVCGPVPGCLTRGGGGDLSINPRIVEVGQVVTFKLTDNGGYGGVAPGWSFSTGPFSPASGLDLGTSPVLKQLGCKGKVVEKPSGKFDVSKGLAGSAYCRYRVVRPGRGWQVATASFSVRYGGLASYSQESWAALPKESVVEGYVRGKPQHPHEKGIGLSNVKVKAAGHGGSSSTTNSEGFYAIELRDPGRFDVIPRLRSSDEALRPRPHFTPASRKVHVNSDHIKDVSFALNRGDSLRIRFVDSNGREIGSIPADGASSASVVVDATDANDQPINSNNGGMLQLFVDNGRLSTKAVVCSAGNIRIWPGKGAGPGLGGAAPVDTTSDTSALNPDSKGVLKLAVYAGTEAGALELTVRLDDPTSAEPGVSKSLTLASTADNFSLQQVMTAAKAQDPQGFPGHDGPNTSISSELDWLQGAKESHLMPGWEYAPVARTDETASGIYFYKNGNLGNGGVLSSDSQGFQPLLDGSPLPSLAAWSGAGGYHFFLRNTGYHGDRFFYFGWPYENGPADRCIRNGPD
jgi:hypothetical protein